MTNCMNHIVGSLLGLICMIVIMSVGFRLMLKELNKRMDEERNRPKKVKLNGSALGRRGG